MIKEFTVGCSRTINLGNFESARVEASVTVDVPQGSNHDHEYQILTSYAQRELRKLLEDTYRNQYADRKKIS